MKTRLVILLVLVLAAIIGLAVLAMRQPQSSQHEKTQPTEDSRALRRSSGEFLAPDTTNDVLSDINKKPATPLKASPPATPAP